MKVGVLDTKDPEERFIRVLLIAGAAALIAGLMLTATLVMVMVAENFNLLDWME